MMVVQDKAKYLEIYRHNLTKMNDAELLDLRNRVWNRSSTGGYATKDTSSQISAIQEELNLRGI